MGIGPSPLQPVLTQAPGVGVEDGAEDRHHGCTEYLEEPVLVAKSTGADKQ